LILGHFAPIRDERRRGGKGGLLVEGEEEWGNGGNSIRCYGRRAALL